MTRTEAIRSYVARVDKVDRLLAQAASTNNPAVAARLMAMAEIQSSLADSAARVVCALSEPPSQEG